MARDTDPRLLRSFVAAAEELHFTRAAARLFVTQQSLSRDIRRLEEEWSLPLFVRTTRQVTLTADGRRLLAHARRVLAAHEELAAAVGAAGHRPLIVDIAAPVTTGRRVLDAAREAEPDLEFVARFHSGLSGAAAEMATGGVDVSFGRIAGLSPALRAGLRHTLIRYERVAVLLPAGPPLAGRPLPAAVDGPLHFQRLPVRPASHGGPQPPLVVLDGRIDPLRLGEAGGGVVEVDHGEGSGGDSRSCSHGSPGTFAGHQLPTNCA
jgi:DNA-binding transcriptional LysR family regulator